MIFNDYLSVFRYISRNKMLRIALYVFLVSFLALFVEAAMWSSTKFENSKLRQTVKLNIEQNYKQEQLGKLTAHLKNVLPLLESLEAKYTTDSTQSDIMKQIGELARQNNLHVLSQSYGHPADEVDKSSTSTIELRITGRYADLRRMLNKIPAMHVWAEITEIRLERLKDNQNIGAQIKLVVLKERA